MTKFEFYAGLQSLSLGAQQKAQPERLGFLITYQNLIPET
jgi:hypothetical protein